MRSREWPNRLYDVAESQLGYFTAAQARAVGVHPVRLIQLHQGGDIERISRGVYRLARFPLSPLGQYMEAALWPQVRRPGARAVISHASALALHELSEVSPAKIHITLPPDLRVRRAVPPQLVVHGASLAPGDVQVVEGVPVTTPTRTIRDAHAAHLGPALIRRAIADGRRTGRLTQSEADRLLRELLDDVTPPAGVLARYARAYARDLGVSEGRVRAWISYMILAGLLEKTAGTAGYRFTVKGGVALELRFRDRARATKDIDLVLHHEDADLARALEDAVVTGDARGYQGFEFRRKGEPLVLENRTISVEFAVTYRGGTWTTIIVDVARAEPGEADIELVPAVPLQAATGIIGPNELVCLSLRMHIAQKLHGMTLPPRPGKRNERFKDLVDVLLMEALVTDFSGQRAACELVFRTRDTHAWPPMFEVPPHWVKPFAALARELDLPVRDAREAIERVRAFVERIQNT